MECEPMRKGRISFLDFINHFVRFFIHSNVVYVCATLFGDAIIYLLFSFID